MNSSVGKFPADPIWGLDKNSFPDALGGQEEESKSFIGREMKSARRNIAGQQRGQSADPQESANCKPRK